ncbi:tyrosine-type recombinase/integrase [Naasia lichenicola]|uniref:Site-specific integrase n=1 Tax=Naasia lichenicola TaxID=2565933 RepID=A0A4S4FTG3_9MICO|nr:tyrosine-type recombinase/integrase [Naasia lichenicola]THG32866.1 site-specific integrase [Naasia lichenicola]
MGTIDSYPTSSGNRYRVTYRKPDHLQTTKRGFRTKKEAQIFLANVESRKADGTYIDPASARATVGQLGVGWLAGQTHLKPSSIAVVESSWRLHVEPVWGSKSVGEIRFSDVQTWVADLARGSSEVKAKSASSVLRAHGILASVLEAAVRDHRIPSNPARGVMLPRKVGREHRYLTHEQLHRLAEASGTYSTLIRLLGYTGLRWGEATGLRPQDINLERRRISVVQNAVLVKGEVIIGTPKTHKRRSVPFPAFLVPALTAALAGREREDFVFADLRGRPLVTPTAQPHSWYNRSMAAAGLPGMTIHDLRHTAASLAIAAGANVKAVQKMLGHASAAMTLDVYADLFDDDLDAVATRLDQAARSASVIKLADS